MAEFTPTPSQREAIENRGGALLVSAAAGSGKTRVLTERLIGRITDPADSAGIEDFLVITYTKAAAAELRSRIADAIGERVAADPSARALRRQSALAQSARIGTIHSFCAELLREHCHLLELPPDFAIADEDRARLLKKAALRRTLEAAYERAEPDFLALADTVGAGRDDSRLEELVERLHGRLQCHARPESWAEEQTAALARYPATGDAGETDAGRILLDGVRETALCWSDRLAALIDSLGGDYSYILKSYGASLDETRDALTVFAAGCLRGWDAARVCLPIPFPRFGSIRSPQHPGTVEYVKAVRDDCKAAVKKLDAVFAESSEKLLADAAATVPAMSALLRLVTDFDARFTAAKRRRSLVDFSDLEHLAARLLTNPDGTPTQTAREVSARFAEVMVDEYQDVSRVQELIINAVSDGGRKLFMVGDVKQAIYRFRLADPTIFIEKYLTYSGAENAAEGEPRRVLLRENFRSRAAVLEGVNSVFGNLMSRALGELDYDGDAALRPGLPDEGGSPIPELIVLRRPGADDGEERPDKVAAEARYVARRILELVAGGETVRENGAERPVGFGDVAILLRSANVAGGIYRRELTRAGIPVMSEQSGGFFDSPEVSVMLSLLAVVDNPRQDVALIAALRSELFGFTPDELSAIRARDMQGDFFSALTLSADGDARCAAFLDTLALLRRYAADSTPAELLTEIYNRLDCMALTCAAPDGAARRENLMLLTELARKFASVSASGSVHRFLEWLRSMSERGEEPRVGAAMSGGAVRIMSVHKSKGLEFPVVFLCDTSRRFNKTDLRESVLVHPALGLGPKLTDAARGVEYPTLPRRGIAAKLERETLSEELRLLYVAMTRARERLFITACLPDPGNDIDRISRAVTAPMHPVLLAGMASDAMWLIAAALADEVRSDATGTPRRFTMSVAEPAEETETAARDEASGEDIAAEPDPALASALDWRYANESAVALPSKVTATELKRAGEDDPEARDILPRKARELRRPDLSGAERPLTGAERGTAAHKLLRGIDLARTGSAEEVRGETERLAAAGYLSRREAAAVDAGDIARFFASEAGARVLSADRVWREFPFTLLRPAEEFFPGGGQDAVLLQGVVDCCIEERGELTVIDFKTDAVSGPALDERARFYSAQVRAYASAMAAITGKPVKDCLLFFLKAGKAVRIEQKIAEKH